MNDLGYPYFRKPPYQADWWELTVANCLPSDKLTDTNSLLWKMNMSYGVQLCLPIEKWVIFQSYLSLSQGIVVALKNCPGCGGGFFVPEAIGIPFGTWSTFTVVCRRFSQFHGSIAWVAPWSSLFQKHHWRLRIDRNQVPTKMRCETR